MKRSGLLALAALLSLTGCTSASPGASSAGSQTDSSFSSAQPVSVTDSEMKQMSAFSFDFFEHVRKPGENQICSPLSAFFALGMAANGADGTTLEQMESVLHLDTEQINRLSRSALAKNSETSQLKIANSLWVSDHLSQSLAKPFETIMHEDYQADASAVPFDKSTVREINDWVSKKTDGMIPEMISSCENVSMMLINALAFDALWQIPYEESQLMDLPFYNADGSEKETQFMLSDEDLYIETPQLEGFYKPYEEHAYSLAVLIPKDSQSLDDVLENLDTDALQEGLSNPKSITVHAALPAFDSESEMDLIDSLKAMGMIDAFEDTADFSRLTDTDDSFSISSVLQKAKIEVDSNGTKAAASTSVAISETSAIIEEETKTITCDRPFLYMIVDTQDHVPVFIGTIQKF